MAGVRIVIEATDLPGTPGVLVGVQRKGHPGELLDPVPADRPSARWAVESGSGASAVTPTSATSLGASPGAPLDACSSPFVGSSPAKRSASTTVTAAPGASAAAA